MKAKTQLAKLTRPSPGAAYARTRLFEQLERPGAAPVIWLNGPPGAGKTTLVADYTVRRGLDCLWYQLDRGDTDVASFFFYLAEAVRGREGRPLPQFQPEYLGDLEAFARNYFRELFGRLTPPFAVFDNYQDVATSTALQGVIRDALTELPDEGRLFVLSRTDPPASFARVRASGRLEVIGWNELRLGIDECRGIADRRGVRLSDEEIERLHARTQGWAAGLVLLLQDVGSTVTQLPQNGASGTPSVIFDYLAEEVFQKFEPGVREFLLRASYLPQITMSMACALGPAEHFEGALRDLARSEFLLTLVSNDPEPMFQFHPLLREFLRARAEETGSREEIEGRKRSAAAVLADHNHLEAAATLLIRIRDWDGLAANIARQADTLLQQGRNETLARWIRALPPERRATDPWMQYWLGVSRFPYDPREARQLFSEALRAFVAAERVDINGVLSAINGGLESVVHDPDDFTLLDPWIEAAAKWTRDLERWPSTDLEARLTCNMFMALVLRQPQHADVPLWRERTQALSQTQRDPNVRITIDSVLTTLSAWNGQFAGGERLLEEMREIARLPDVSPVSATKFALTESTFYMLAGDHERCLDSARRGLDIVGRSGVRVWNDTFLVNALCGALGDADLDAAAERLRQIESQPLAGRRFDVFLHAYGAAWFAMLRGDTFLAHQHLKGALRAAGELGVPFFQIIATLALAQVLFESGNERGAEVELARAVEIAGNLRNRLLDFMIAMCRAALAMHRGDDAATLDALRVGLGLGRERNLMHFLWWQPHRVARLCQRALEAGIEPDYVRRLISRRELMPQPPPYHLESWPWRYRVRALGTFQLEVAEGETAAVEKRTGRPLELLKALIAFGGEHVKLERVADALWPHVDSDYAHRSLNTTLHRLRRSLGDESAILVRAGELAINRRLFWLDTWGFERAYEEALAWPALSDGNSPLSGLVALAHRALDFYRGPLLRGEKDLAWAIAPREQYRGQLLRLLTTVCQRLESSANLEDALELYRRGLEREPLAEALHRRLMLTLKQAGRVSDAIEAYHRCQAMLKAELRSEPSAATQDIYRSLGTA